MVPLVLGGLDSHSMPARIGNVSEVATSLGNWSGRGSETPESCDYSKESEQQLHTVIGRKGRILRRSTTDLLYSDII